MSLRKALNLTYTWLFDLIGGTDQWKKDYEHVFNPDMHADFDYVDIGPSSGTQAAGTSTRPRGNATDKDGNTVVDVADQPVAKLLFHGY